MTAPHDSRGHREPVAEILRLREDDRREKNWKRWGPYLADRQWATVREDYSPDGNCWGFFPHEHARMRAYRWGEDGLLGITDRQCRLCFALALWNGRDPILKERLFGLTGPEGNHGEDVKECYFHLDGTPTHSYMAALYKYPQCEFPYAKLVAENRRRGRAGPEYELADAGVFDGDRYFDVTVEYAKADPDHIEIRITAANRGPEPAELHVLPTLWFRNTWAWGCRHEGHGPRPQISRLDDRTVFAEHHDLGRYRLEADPGPDGRPPEWLFTENESNAKRLWNLGSRTVYVKDGFHDRVVRGRKDAVNPAEIGTKAAAWYRTTVPARGTAVFTLRLGRADHKSFGPPDGIVAARRREADEFYDRMLAPGMSAEDRRIARRAYAGLLWNKQFYHFVVKDWLEGDPGGTKPPEIRKQGRNRDWAHLFNRDVLSVPDKWEFPWPAAWDLAFHMVPFARLDPAFAKEQLLLFLREWYMHPNGQIPAYEFEFSDVNPPVHAFAVWRVYKLADPKGRRDRAFLARCFHKLMLNFAWWVNRKDVAGRHVFSGGFLGLDNIGIFDRNRTLPEGGLLEQADGTAWMAFFCASMLSIALELAEGDPVYEDVASKFFEHFVAIADAMNTVGGTGLWDEADGFYYDHMRVGGRTTPLRVRSMVGLVPLFAVVMLDEARMDTLPEFSKRTRWFLRNRPDLARHISYMEAGHEGKAGKRLLAIPSRERLVRVLRRVLDESEFLSPFGVRSLSRHYKDNPAGARIGAESHRITYCPGESDTDVFGGNSNWRGPVWMPMNGLLIRSLVRYHEFYGDTLTIECPTGSGVMMTLAEVAEELTRRLARLFRADASGNRPWAGGDARYASDPHWKDLDLFHEYFHGDDGRGLGASHQTGWTALIGPLLEWLSAESHPDDRHRSEPRPAAPRRRPSGRQLSEP
jgi:hypothetical protein